MRARRFFAGKPSNAPPLFDALMDVFVMKENERKAGSFPVPFSPCGMLKPSRDSAVGENLLDLASVSQEKPSPEDVKEVVGMTKKLQDTCRYLKGKSTDLHLYRILNTNPPLGHAVKMLPHRTAKIYSHAHCRSLVLPCQDFAMSSLRMTSFIVLPTTLPTKRNLREKWM